MFVFNLILFLFVSFWLSFGDLDLLYWFVRNFGMDCMFLLWDDVLCDIVWVRFFGSEVVFVLIMLVKSFWKFEFK